MMKHGYMVMMPKLRINRPSGSFLDHQNQNMKCQSFADCFFYYLGVMHQELLPQDRMVNKEYFYFEVISRLHKTEQKNVWSCGNGSHGYCSQFLANNNTVTMPQPPFSPDLVSSDFYLFPKERPMGESRSLLYLREITLEGIILILMHK